MCPTTDKLLVREPGPDEPTPGEASEPGSLKVVLVDDHDLLRDGLRSILEKAGLQVLGEARTGREALLLVERLKPDLVLMDIAMPELNGIDATQILSRKAPDVKVIGVSMHADRRHVVGMFSAGAAGYVVKDAPAAELIDAIRAVAKGLKYISPRVAAHVLDGAGSGAGASSAKALSSREREVLQLVAEGLTSKEIAVALGLAVPTVETHRRQLSEKLQLNSIAELTKYAIREGITDLG